jgi:fatty-acyl-CoA synthase
MLTHRTFVMMSLLLIADWDWPEEIRFAAVTPISHAAGVTIFPIMCRGGFTRLMDGFDARSFCVTVQSQKINSTFLVPTIIYSLLDHPEIRSEYDLWSLESIIYGAAPMSPSRLRQSIDVFGPVFVQMCGQTESPQCIMTLRNEDHDLSRPHRFGSCGRPAPSLTVKLFDKEMREVATGQAGEVCVRGPLVMDGWKREDATKDAFRGGWLHTGDVAIKDEEARYCVGRHAEHVSGFFVEAAGVERRVVYGFRHAVALGEPVADAGSPMGLGIILRETFKQAMEMAGAQVRCLREPLL